MLKKIFGNAAAWGPFFLRLAVGAVFIAHGAQKLFGVFGGHGLKAFAGMLGQMGLRPAMAWAVLVAVVELLGGIFLVLGILTRLSALLIGIVMVVAIVGVHLTGGFFSFEFPLVLLAACISLLLTGGGPASIKE
ncbi:MAG: DoxX family protein [PVC group bacterium]